MIYLPPFSISQPGAAHPLPTFLQPYPTAVINYRWPGFPPEHHTPSDVSLMQGEARNPTPLHWPLALTDVTVSYQWLAENLFPDLDFLRDVYLYGSYLGATLAMSLALTESRPSGKFCIAGVAAYNGVYNWTDFLPGSKTRATYRPRAAKSASLAASKPVPGASSKAMSSAAASPGCPAESSVVDVPPSSFAALPPLIPALFNNPSNLFDPFASPCLFFRTSGMHVPASFNTNEPLSSPIFSTPPASPGTTIASTASSTEEIALLDYEAGDTSLMPPTLNSSNPTNQSTPPPSPAVPVARRRAHLQFPPRDSDLRIPQTLLVAERDESQGTPTTSTKNRKSRTTRKATVRKRRQDDERSFEQQAYDLAVLMQRSVDRHEAELPNSSSSSRQPPPRVTAAPAIGHEYYTGDHDEDVTDYEDVRDSDAYKHVVTPVIATGTRKRDDTPRQQQQQRVHLAVLPAGTTGTGSTAVPFEVGEEGERVLAAWFRERVALAAAAGRQGW